MLTVQKLTTVQDISPGLTIVTLIAWTLGPELKNSFSNKQSAKTKSFFFFVFFFYFFGSINNHPQST